MARAEARMGNNAARFAAGNNYIGLNISNPVGGIPYRFFYTYLAEPPFEHPMGTEKSIFSLNWRAIPYTQDPYGGGAAQPNTVPGFGALGALLYDHNLDT
jgi:hypothetical protein